MIKTADQGEDYLYSFIRPTTETGNPDFSFGRVAEFAGRLDNPQDKTRVIHVAGTSGKGSTCTYLSALLGAYGFKVGLTLSPHLIDIRERYQINNALISEEKFVSYLNELVPHIESMKVSEYGVPSFFEISILLAYHIFARENVTYAIIETGLGGRLDATNVARSREKVAVLTRIGKDHMDILGSTIGKIASEKSGIIHKGNTVITIAQRRSAMEVIKERVKSVGGQLNIIASGQNYCKYLRAEKIEFDYTVKDCRIKQISLDTQAGYQVENAALALRTVQYLSERDTFPLNEMIIRSVLVTTKTPARFEIFEMQERMIIVDGAHNAQKMQSFTRSLKKVYPSGDLGFIVAFKKGKDYRRMLRLIVSLADSITVTRFGSTIQIKTNEGEDPEKIAFFLKEVLGFQKSSIETDPKQAFRKALSKGKNPIVITGSLYLISELYPLLLAGKDRV